MYAATIKNTFVYFGLVFAAGFVLGTIRVLLLEPKIGETLAELIETPVMLVVIYFAAKYVVFRCEALNNATAYLIMGMMALVLMLALEFTVVLGMQGQTITNYFADKDKLALTVYAGALLIFMTMPCVLKLNTSEKKG